MNDLETCKCDFKLLKKSQVVFQANNLIPKGSDDKKGIFIIYFVADGISENIRL